MAESLNIVLWTAKPAIEKPGEFVTRLIERRRMHGPNLRSTGLPVHLIVESVHKRTHRRLATDRLEGSAAWTKCGTLITTHREATHEGDFGSKRRMRMFRNATRSP